MQPYVRTLTPHTHATTPTSHPANARSIADDPLIAFTGAVLGASSMGDEPYSYYTRCVYGGSVFFLAFVVWGIERMKFREAQFMYSTAVGELWGGGWA